LDIATGENSKERAHPKKKPKKQPGEGGPYYHRLHRRYVKAACKESEDTSMKKQNEKQKGNPNVDLLSGRGG